MKNVLTIYEAKTNLSKLIKQVENGSTIYIGAYGQPQAILTTPPAKKPLTLGVLAHKKQKNAYKYSELVGSDIEVNAEFENSSEKPLV